MLILNSFKELPEIYSLPPKFMLRSFNNNSFINDEKKYFTPFDYFTLILHCSNYLMRYLNVKLLNSLGCKGHLTTILSESHPSKFKINLILFLEIILIQYDH